MDIGVAAFFLQLSLSPLAKILQLCPGSQRHVFSLADLGLQPLKIALRIAGLLVFSSGIGVVAEWFTIERFWVGLCHAQSSAPAPEGASSC